jgi:hypothetical protein
LCQVGGNLVFRQARGQRLEMRGDGGRPGAEIDGTLLLQALEGLIRGDQQQRRQTESERGQHPTPQQSAAGELHGISPHANPAHL